MLVALVIVLITCLVAVVIATIVCVRRRRRRRLALKRVPLAPPDRVKVHQKAGDYEEYDEDEDDKWKEIDALKSEDCLNEGRVGEENHLEPFTRRTVYNYRPEDADIRSLESSPRRRQNYFRSTCESRDLNGGVLMTSFGDAGARLPTDSDVITQQQQQLRYQVYL